MPSFSARIFADRDIKMYEAAVQRRLGQLCGGSEGQSLIAAGERFMRAQHVKNLEAMTELLCPGIRG